MQRGEADHPTTHATARAWRVTRRTCMRLLAGVALSPSLALAGCATTTLSAPKQSFPAFVYSSATSLEAYQQATRNTDLFAIIPCYCGCGGLGHRSLKECFIKPDGAYEAHASACGICVDEALMAAKLRQEGQDFRTIRVAIDTRFAGSGPPTNTAMP